ncbi:MAG: histidine phosphatase family protein [Ilumatobacteraceae bacterium]
MSPNTSTTTRLLLIRHGESKSNAERWISGHNTCGGLTDLGRAQASLLSERLARSSSAAPDVVLSSTMPRAVATAEIVATPIGSPVRQMFDLSERIPGECEGVTFEEYHATYGKFPFVDWEPALSPGGESNIEFLARITRVLAEVTAEHDGRTVWIVCHGGIIMGATALLMRTPGGAAAPQWQNPANTSVTEFVRATIDARWTLQRYNDHAHLEGHQPLGDVALSV